MSFRTTDEESGDEGDGPRLGQLVKDLAGSREMMTNLTQALIPSLMEQLKSGEGLNELFNKQQPAQKVTSRGNPVSSNLTQSVTQPTFSGTIVNPSNAAGNNGGTAAVWSNAAPQGNAAQIFPWTHGGAPTVLSNVPSPNVSVAPRLSLYGNATTIYGQSGSIFSGFSSTIHFLGPVRLGLRHQPLCGRRGKGRAIGGHIIRRGGR